MESLFSIALPPLEEPIRALFSGERLEQHGESLAAAQSVTTTPRKGRPLLPRVLHNGRVLLKAYRAIAQAIREERAITPAAEWLVDNYHIVDEQLREIHDDLPSGYYRELPKLAEGHLQGYPRVLGLAWAFVAHTDSRFDPEMLRDPCIQRPWRSFKITFRYQSSRYVIVVEKSTRGNARGVVYRIRWKRMVSGSMYIHLAAHDGAKHRVRVVLGEENSHAPR